MSKATVKKILMSMPKEEIIGMVLEMYDARKEAKEYLEFYANPDEDGKLEEYKKLKPSADKLADLMLCYVENACRFTYDYGDMWEQYYTSVENNFDKTMAFIAKNNMLEHFKPRLRQCVEWASPCGWGFADTIADIYYEHFPEDD